MKTIRMYIGLNDKDTINKRRRRNKIIVNNIGDCTIQPATGHYTHEDSTPTTERTLLVTKFVSDLTPQSALVNLIEKLKAELNQECIVIEIIQDVNVSFM